MSSPETDAIETEAAKAYDRLTNRVPLLVQEPSLVGSGLHRAFSVMGAMGYDKVLGYGEPRTLTGSEQREVNRTMREITAALPPILSYLQEGSSSGHPSIDDAYDIIDSADERKMVDLAPGADPEATRETLIGYAEMLGQLQERVPSR